MRCNMEVFIFLPFCVDLHSRLRLVQTEIAFLLVGQNRDLQASVVGRRHFDSALPVHRGEVRRGFENESGGRERPGNYGGGAGAARNGEVNTGGDAGVELHRDGAYRKAVRNGKIGLAVTVEVPRHDENRLASRGVVDWGLEGAIAVA